MSQSNGSSKQIVENRRAARASGLRYIADDCAGIRRVRAGRGFAYVSSRGRRVRDPATLQRIRGLVIPPAWTEVWICLDPKGHIQAVGRDDRGRKQYLYHARWREARDRDKYHKLIDFASALPRIRRAIKHHLAQQGLPRIRVLAAVLAVMEQTLIRIGNDEYAGQNGSFGLTTLRDRHARINGRKVRFEFNGKSGIEHEIDLHDPRLTQIIRRCRDLPGQELFQYLDDDGNVCDVGSSDVNDYLRQISGADFTTKDFRTWAGTVLAACALREMDSFKSIAQAKRNLVRAIDAVADRLGNTRAVCRKSYIHPEVIDSYLRGGLMKGFVAKGRPAKSVRGLRPEENAVLGVLARRPGAASRRAHRKGK
jgi:DNA topoisomerase-1